MEMSKKKPGRQKHVSCASLGTELGLQGRHAVASTASLKVSGGQGAQIGAEVAGSVVRKNPGWQFCAATATVRTRKTARGMEA